MFNENSYKDYCRVYGIPQEDEKKNFYRFNKRIFDLLFSLSVIFVLFIPCLVIALLIYIQTGGNPFYTQERVGQFGKKFKIYKFRSMVVDSDNLEKYLSSSQLEIWKKERKVENDPRITRIGHFLRATSLDELPQFINVIFGDMSIVGPRAITVDELEWFGSDKAFLLSVPAGITGLWQTKSRNQATFESGERQKLELQYCRDATFILDVKIIIDTVWVVINKTGR